MKASSFYLDDTKVTSSFSNFVAVTLFFFFFLPLVRNSRNLELTIYSIRFASIIQIAFHTGRIVHPCPFVRIVLTIINCTPR